MKESAVPNISIQALRGVNQTPSERIDEFATLQNVAPDEVGRLSRILGKQLIEKVAGPVMTIHQFWNAYGYGARLRQTDGGIISDPEPPGDPGFKQPNEDYPLGCKPVKPFSNKLKLQYLDRRTDFVYLEYNWNRCAGTDFDSRTALVECSIAGVPIFDGTIKQAIVGYFHDGPVMDFNHGGHNIIGLAADNTYPSERVVVNLDALRQLAGNVAFTAKFQLKGYFFSYISEGNVVVYFDQYEKGKSGSYERYLDGIYSKFLFFNCPKKYPRKSWKASIVTQTATPILTTGDNICYLYVKFHPFAQRTKDKIWIDDV